MLAASILLMSNVNFPAALGGVLSFILHSPESSLLKVSFLYVLRMVDKSFPYSFLKVICFRSNLGWLAV